MDSATGGDAVEHGGVGDGRQRRRRVWVVGPGFRFLSGLTVYTCRLANALSVDHDVSVLLLRDLIPARLFPGGRRVGQDLSSLRYAEDVRIVGEIDWFWGDQVRRAAKALAAERPDVLVLQWWTAATLHTYLALAAAARRVGVPVVIEFHEVQDTGEASVPFVASYCRRVMPALLARASGALVHNKHDLDLLHETYGAGKLDHLAVEIAPHGPYDHLPPATAPRTAADPDPDGVTRLLFFGLIRPYKGVEDLVTAFNALSADEAAAFTLTIVGETWEGWTLPAELIERSPHRDRITFVNRYVSDQEAGRFFAEADALVLPYRRGSASGPLQIAMSSGLHVLLYAVGGLVEAVADYEGAVLVTPDDVVALRERILDLPAHRARRFDDPHSWAATSSAIDRIAGALAPLRAAAVT
ncbi:glycosyltransferase [Umezawaea sp. Da 62-37]|uniref:glycosyltransferase n=1 Tax=Umezawaea sp. Da 62-37 TaxID=3075927 RepID=UPI0028F6EF2C|nr:glycosyltransferase [Umezawaea sp. Da 62-37]WNV85109.1 glycosyltransferase [Umezawaea sp. Da 62-37]